jgi:LysR family glycine cleavage system transcriptional activator
LRGFAAAARSLSFTAAAEELHLTQSAISRQVGGLERELGHRLFVRKTRALELTEAGARLYRVVREGIAAIDQCVGQIRGTAAAPRVTLTTYSSLASMWLVPRLASFQREHPAIEIRIEASDRVVDLQAEGVDLALRRCRPQSAPPGSVLLLEELATPVLSPALPRRLGMRCAAPQDLLRMPLIDIDSRVPNDPDSWESWFAMAGVDATRGARSGMLFVGYSDQSVQAAARGQGVALVPSTFYADLVVDGQLVAPFASVRLKTGYVLVLVENPAPPARPEVALLRDWLLGQFRRFERTFRALEAGPRARPPARKKPARARARAANQES